MQNLPQNKMPDAELDIARQLVRAGDLETLEMCFDNTAGTLSQLIRTAFVPRKGCRFIVSDFSAIEARVLAWLAGEEWRLEVFNTHGKIYEASAEQMFHLLPGSVKKGDPMRQKGKIAELALGYGGSVGAMKSMGALEMGLREDELKPIVDSWRAANRSITDFWWKTDAATRKTILTKATTKLPHDMGFFKEGPLLRLRLPNGRTLSYVRPAVVEDNITYEGNIQTTGQWGRIESYGPKLVENIVQAVARDCLAEAMIRLEENGFPVVFHVHDEVICEVEEGRSSAKELGLLMAEPIPWAPGLPLKADAYECEYYRKD
jgi:DNA polymerase